MKHREKQLEVWLNEATESFLAQNESYLFKIPPTVRNVKMRDLVDKYGGNITACEEALAADNCESINALRS